MGCTEWGGRRRGGHEISCVTLRLGGVGTLEDSAIIYYD